MLLRKMLLELEKKYDIELFIKKNIQKIKGVTALQKILLVKYMYMKTLLIFVLWWMHAPMISSWK